MIIGANINEKVGKLKNMNHFAIAYSETFISWMSNEQQTGRNSLLPAYCP
jgi:hypothetical protein